MMYKRGYVHITTENIDISICDKIREMSGLCEEFILGIPDKQVDSRLLDADNGYDPEKTADLLKCFDFITDVVILSYDLLGIEAEYEQVGFDAYFYGYEAGKRFFKDLKFAEEKGISMVSAIPVCPVIPQSADAVRMALHNVHKEQKIVLFGAGAYSDFYMKKYGIEYRPAYFVDNDSSKWGTAKWGIKIESPKVLFNENPKDVLVIICCKGYEEIRDQIRNAGDYDYRALRFDNRIGLLDEAGKSLKEEQQYIREAQTALKEMLKSFDEVCVKNNIRYYLICGSLIGAIRHKGFIPWDDDVDIAISRDDYTRLRKLIPNEFGTDGRYRLIDFYEIGDNVFLDVMARVIDVTKKVPNKVFNKVPKERCTEGPNRLFLDIYIMDNAYDNKLLHKIHMLRLQFTYNLLMGHRGKINHKEYAKLPKWQVMIMDVVHNMGRLFSCRRLCMHYEKLAMKADKIKSESYFMSSCAITCIGRRFKKSFFEEGLRVPFEDIEVTIPKDYDGLLEAMMYGDYMTPPPYNMRRPSHYYNSDMEIW